MCGFKFVDMIDMLAATSSNNRAIGVRSTCRVEIHPAGRRPRRAGAKIVTVHVLPRDSRSYFLNLYMYSIATAVHVAKFRYLIVINRRAVSRPAAV
eukprot:SAG31_NODE_192_length_20788_cov_8.938083_4_plen_96_part_00